MDTSRPFFREVSANPRVSALRSAARWGVVQLVGHLTVNEDGEGSNPSAPANFIPTVEEPLRETSTQRFLIAAILTGGWTWFWFRLPLVSANIKSAAMRAQC
jgi:hypothetical protein